MNTSELLEEAYASFSDDSAFLVTAEFDHPGFESLIRVVTGINPPDGDFTVPIPLPIEAGGPKLDHTACAFRYLQPGANEDGPMDGRLQIDGVSGLVYPYLRAALGFGAPIYVTIRTYRYDPTLGVESIVGPDEEFAGFQMSNADLPDEVTIEGTIRYPDGRQINFPTGEYALFDRMDYPGLFS